MKKITLLLLIALTTITTQAQNKLLSSISENYIDGNWENNYATNYTYIDGTTLSSETELSWENGAWKNNYQTQYGTNFFSKKIERIFYYEWNDTKNIFESVGYDAYSYDRNATPSDTNVKLIEIVGYEYLVPGDVNTSKKVEKTEISYGGNNLPAIVVEYAWNETEWVNEFRTTYTYNNNNKIISDIEQKWEASQWVNIRKALYSYNANNKLTTVEGADWDKFNNNWIADDENVFDYLLDTNGNRISITESGYKTDYTYDTTQLMNNFSHPFRDKTGLDYFGEDYPYINKLLTETNNNGTSRTTYNYNNTITLSKDTFKKEVATTVYPNPTSEYLIIQNESNVAVDKVTITDLSGKKVLEQNNAKQINVRNLTKGIYILGIYSGDKKETKKFIKE